MEDWSIPLKSYAVATVTITNLKSSKTVQVVEVSFVSMVSVQDQVYQQSFFPEPFCISDFTTRSTTHLEFIKE